MKYEKTPVRGLVKRKAIAKLTTDMSKLSTFNIVRYLYKRHEITILYIVVAVTWAWALVEQI